MISLLTFDYKILIVLVFPPISAFLLVKGLNRKIGGATGDILGAVCEPNQCIFVVLACAIMQKLVSLLEENTIQLKIRMNLYKMQEITNLLHFVLYILLYLKISYLFLNYFHNVIGC